jgi:hypothetical protein
MKSARSVATMAGAVLATGLLVLQTAPAGSVASSNVTTLPVLSELSLTNTQIHAVGAEGTALPKRTKLKLTLNVDALVRIRVKAIDPYGLSRAFNVTLPAGPSAVTFSARVDGTRLPPGGYKVVVKAHSADGSSDKKFLRLKIVG